MKFISLFLGTALFSSSCFAVYPGACVNVWLDRELAQLHENRRMDWMPHTLTFLRRLRVLSDQGWPGPITDNQLMAMINRVLNRFEGTIFSPYAILSGIKTGSVLAEWEPTLRQAAQQTINPLLSQDVRSALDEIGATRMDESEIFSGKYSLLIQLSPFQKEPLPPSEFQQLFLDEMDKRGYHSAPLVQMALIHYRLLH